MGTAKLVAKPSSKFQYQLTILEGHGDWGVNITGRGVAPYIGVTLNPASTTLTVKSQLALLLQQSVTMQCTFVTIPGANTLPDGGANTTVTLVQQVPVTVAEYAIPMFVQDVTTIFDGHRITGASNTVTVWLQVLLLPHVSTANHVRVTNCVHVPVVTVL